MIAHLYRIPSGFANTPPKIVIRSSALAQYPGTWLHATVALPEGATVPENAPGEGCIILPDGEITSMIAPGKDLKLSEDGTAYIGQIRIYNSSWNAIVSQDVLWR